MAKEPRFPTPKYFGRLRYWALSELLRYEAELAGLSPPDPIPPEQEKYLPASQVKARYGGVSDMWLWRRTAAHTDSAAA